MLAFLNTIDNLWSEEEICVYKISSEMLSDLFKIMKLVLQKNKIIEQDIPGTEKAVESIVSFYLTNKQKFEAFLCIHSNAYSIEASEDEAFWDEENSVGQHSTESEDCDEDPCSWPTALNHVIIEDWDEETSVCTPEPKNHLVEDWPEDMCVGIPSNSALDVEESYLGEVITSQETNKDEQTSDDSCEPIEFVQDHGYWIEWQAQRKEQTNRYVQKLCNQAETDLIASEKLNYSVNNSQSILCVQQSVEKYLKATWLSGSYSPDTTMIAKDYKTHDLNYLAATVAKSMEKKLKIPSEDKEEYGLKTDEYICVREISELEIYAKKMEQLGQRTDDSRPLCIRARYPKTQLTESSIEQTPCEIFTNIDVQQAIQFAKEIKQICLDYIQVYKSL